MASLMSGFLKPTLKMSNVKPSPLKLKNFGFLDSVVMRLQKRISEKLKESRRSLSAELHFFFQLHTDIFSYLPLHACY